MNASYIRSKATHDLRQIVSLSKTTLEMSRKSLAETRQYESDPFWKRENDRVRKDIKRVEADMKACIAELRRRGIRTD